jgi:ATP-dependent DNA helicase RecG
MTGAKLGNDSRTRISTMVRTQDGFEISEVDLRLRGPGDIMGTQQSGIPELHMADLVEDAEILQDARRVARRLLDEDPELQEPKNAAIAGTLREQMKEKAVWGRIG